MSSVHQLLADICRINYGTCTVCSLDGLDDPIAGLNNLVENLAVTFPQTHILVYVVHSCMSFVKDSHYLDDLNLHRCHRLSAAKPSTVRINHAWPWWISMHVAVATPRRTSPLSNYLLIQ